MGVLLPSPHGLTTAPSPLAYMPGPSQWSCGRDSPLRTYLHWFFLGESLPKRNDGVLTGNTVHDGDILGGDEDPTPDVERLDDVAAPNIIQDQQTFLVLIGEEQPESDTFRDTILTKIAAWWTGFYAVDIASNPWKLFSKKVELKKSMNSTEQ